MNWNFISGAGLCGFGGLFMIIGSIAEQYAWKRASERAVSERPLDEATDITRALSEIDICEKLEAAEAKKSKDRIAAWKKTNRYDEQRRDIYAAQAESIGEFKESIDYSTKKKAILDKAESELDGFKASIDYEGQISELEEKIEDAKEKFEKKKKLYDSADSDISDFAVDLRTDAEKTKNKIVGEAQAEIKKLKSRVEEERKRVDRVKQSELQQLETQLSAERSRLKDQTHKKLNTLDTSLADAKKEIERDIYAERSPEEAEAVEFYEENRQIVERVHTADVTRRDSIYKKMTRSEKVAAWLKEKNCPKWFAATVMFLPLIPVTYLVYSYSRFVVNTVKAM